MKDWPTDLLEQIDSLLHLNKNGCLTRPVPGLAVEILEKCRARLSESGRTCAWCDKPWPVEKCGDEDGYGPRPACGPLQNEYLAKFLERLSTWREADHDDALVLSRNDVCQLLDWFKGRRMTASQLSSQQHPGAARE